MKSICPIRFVAINVLLWTTALVLVCDYNTSAWYWRASLAIAAVTACSYVSYATYRSLLRWRGYRR